MEAKKVEDQLKKLSLALDQWKLGILQGKALIGRIIAVVYPSEGTREPTLPDSLSTDCRNNHFVTQICECAHSFLTVVQIQ